MNYEAPGRTESLDDALRAEWNRVIRREFDSLSRYHSRFFTIDGGGIRNPIEARPSWFGDPAEPYFCRNEDIARKLSDWGARGRHEFHNEYCEYTIVNRIAPDGSRRAKRVTVTTELREYWVVVAMHDPVLLRSMAMQVLGWEPSWMELYGVPDPLALSTREREITFSMQTAGHGYSSSLEVPGTNPPQYLAPEQPVGSLNRDNALFMTHPINGLDDLIYILLFGAHPYAQMTPAGRSPATKEQIFRATVFGQQSPPLQLACRHADPAAAVAAHQQAYSGHTIGFANPLGMYINAFTSSVFSYQDAPIPQEWIRISRGHQRLEFGPSDDDSAFLEDIFVSEGAATFPLTGGYDVVRRVEVGPALLIGDGAPVQEAEYINLDHSTAPIVCSDADICRKVRRIEAEYDQGQPASMMRVGPRDMK